MSEGRRIQFHDTPFNLEAMHGELLELDSFAVMQWHPEKDGRGEPTQVHLVLTNKTVREYAFVIRFKGPKTLDALISALAVHRRQVFGAD